MIIRTNITILLDYATLNKAPYLARKKIIGIQLKREFESATKMQRTLKMSYNKLKMKRMKFILKKK